jgi:hypothetical protein
MTDPDPIGFGPKLAQSSAKGASGPDGTLRAVRSRCASAEPICQIAGLVSALVHVGSCMFPAMSDAVLRPRPHPDDATSVQADGRLFHVLERWFFNHLYCYRMNGQGEYNQLLAGQ